MDDIAGIDRRQTTTGKSEDDIRTITEFLRLQGLGAEETQIRNALGATFSIPDVIRLLKDSGLKAGFRRVRADHLARIPLPALAVMRDQKLCMIVRLLESHVLIFDAAQCRPAVEPIEVFLGRWSGVVILSRRKATIQDGERPFGIGWFFVVMHKYRGILAEVLAGSALTLLMDLLFTFVFLGVMLTYSISLTLVVMASMRSGEGKAALTWASIGKVDIVANAPGVIVPIGKAKIVQAVSTANIDAILVEDGQHVMAGQTLIRLDPVSAYASRDKLLADLRALRLDVAGLSALSERLDDPKPDLSFVVPSGADPVLAKETLASIRARGADQAKKLASLSAQIADRAWRCYGRRSFVGCRT